MYSRKKVLQQVLGIMKRSDTISYFQQGVQPAATAYFDHQNIQMSPFQQPHYQLNQQHAQSNPCSGFVNYIISVPSYVFGAVYGAQQPAFNVTVQPVPSNQQVPLIEQVRPVEQIQGAGSFAVGSNQPDQAPVIGEKVKLPFLRTFSASIFFNYHRDSETMPIRIYCTDIPK